MKNHLLILFIIILLMSTICYSQSADSHNNKDTLNSVYVIDTFKVDSGILIAKDGTGFIPFRNITKEQLNYIFEILAYFEKGNKLKQWLDKK